MKKINIRKDTTGNIPKDELVEKHKHKHYSSNSAHNHSFSDHSHGRVNHHSIGYNHEPGTL